MTDWKNLIRPVVDPERNGRQRQWANGLEGMIRQKERGLVFGATGEGKSFVIDRLGERVIRAGGTALLLDYENGAERTEDRVKLLVQQGVDLEELYDEEEVSIDVERELRHFRYADAFPLGAVREDENAWYEFLSSLAEVDLLVIDGLPSLLGQLGLNESLPADMAQFFARYVYPITGQEGLKCAVLLGDNTGWDSSRVRGARAKLDMVELAYRVTGGKSCSPEKHGTINLRNVRDRDGDHHEHLTMGIGGGKYTDLRVAKGSSAQTDEERWHDAVVKLVSAEGPMSRNALEKALREQGTELKRDAFLKAVNGWVEDENDEIALDDRKLVTVLGGEE